MRKIALFLLLFTSGCVTALTASGQKVQIVNNTSEGCQIVGEVHGVGQAGTVGQNIENARADIRNKAGELGADAVVLQTNNQTDARIDLTGQAYKCTNEAAQ
jgi:hypothetical protein